MAIERKYASVIQSRLSTPAVSNCSIRKVRILRGSWTTTRAGSSPAHGMRLGSEHSASGRDPPATAHSPAKGRSTDADGRVPVGEPRLGGGNEPAFGDAHPARGGVLAVHGQQLAVVAPN